MYLPVWSHVLFGRGVLRGVLWEGYGPRDGPEGHNKRPLSTRRPVSEGHFSRRVVVVVVVVVLTFWKVPFNAKLNEFYKNSYQAKPISHYPS